VGNFWCPRSIVGAGERGRSSLPFVGGRRGGFDLAEDLGEVGEDFVGIAEVFIFEEEVEIFLEGAAGWGGEFSGVTATGGGGVIDDEKVAAAVGADEELVVMREGAVEENPREVRIAGRSGAELGAAGRGFAAGDEGNFDADVGEGTALEEGSGEAGEGAEGCGDAEGGASGEDIDSGTGGSSGEGAGEGELPLGKAEDLPGFFGEEIGGIDEIIGGIVADRGGGVVFVEYGEAIVSGGFAYFDDVDVIGFYFFEGDSFLEVAGDVLIGDIGDGAIGDAGGEEVEDDIGGFGSALVPFFFEEADGFLDNGFAIVFDFQELAEEADAFGEAGVMGVELAGEIEGFAEVLFPILCEIGVFGEVIDEGEAGAAGPAEDFHFVEEIGAEGFGCVDDVDDAGAVEDGGEEFAFVGEFVLVAVLADELADGIDAGGGIAFGMMGFEPGEGGGGVGDAGGIDEFDEGVAVDDEGDVLGVGGFAGGGADADAGIIRFLDEGGEDGGLAFVDAADDGELWRGWSQGGLGIRSYEL
jgi:hypothetical protein